MSSPTSSADQGLDLTPLGERLSLLLLVRLIMASIVMLCSEVLPHLQLQHDVIMVARAYAATAIGFELLHRFVTRRTRYRWLWLLNVMLMIDGLFVATVLGGSGQARSTFIFLAYAHIVSVTLLVGFRTGLKVALWQSILLLCMYYLNLAGVIHDGTTTSSDDRKLSSQLEVAQAIALWLVAMATATFASLNERELRRRKGELTIIADLSNRIEQTRRPSEIMEALVEATVENLGCSRAVAVCVHGGTALVVGGDKVLPAIKAESLTSLGGLHCPGFEQCHAGAHPQCRRRGR